MPDPTPSLHEAVNMVVTFTFVIAFVIVVLGWAVSIVRRWFDA